MNNNKSKREFARILAGEPVDWKEYALNLLKSIEEAKHKEHSSDPNSLFYSTLEKQLNKDMHLTRKQITSINDMYIQKFKINDK